MWHLPPSSPLHVAPAPSTPTNSRNRPRGLVQLMGIVQQYDWGKMGEFSIVAKLARAGNSIESVDVLAKYAELWFGTHPSGPSQVYGSPFSLKKLLMDNPGLLNANAPDDSDLCFMFKLVSVNKATPIQVHPSKPECEELHRKNPVVYKDANHKPKMACALTEFEALLGFERVETICRRLESSPELRELVLEQGDDGAQVLDQLSRSLQGDDAKQRRALRAFFGKVLNAPCALVASKVNALKLRLAQGQLEPIDVLAMRLNFNFFHDVGVFGAYLLCYRRLSPGDAIFIDANEPYAYLSGDCVEVLASSDNVVRAALTNQPKDVAVIERVLSYSQAPREGEAAPHHPSIVFNGELRDEFTTVYTPPSHLISEFQLEKIDLPPDSHHHYLLAPSSYGAIVFVLEGCGEARWNDGQKRVPLGRGNTFFQPALTKVKILGHVTLFRVLKRGTMIKMEREKKYEMYREVKKPLPVGVVAPPPLG